MVKLTSLSDGEERPMNDDKGVVRSLVGPEDGARNIDVHVNIIRAEARPFPYHFHQNAENVYVVLDGVAEAIVDGVRHRLHKGDVAFIPPGVPHAAGSAGAGPVTLLEIYAPAGRDFHRLEMPSHIVDADGMEESDAT